jgi:hypothetical protein
VRSRGVIFMPEPAARMSYSNSNVQRYYDDLLHGL